MIIGLIGAIILAVSVLVLWVLAKGAQEVRRDEFNRRNNAGVLEYETYEEAEKARRRKGVLEAFAGLIPIAYFGVIVGIVMLIQIPVQLHKHKLARDEAAAARARCHAGDKSACTCGGGLRYCLVGETPD